MQDFVIGSLNRSVESALTVHDQEMNGFVVHKQFVKDLCETVVVTKVERDVDRLWVQSQ